MNRLQQDIRYALRQLIHNKGFATVAILTLFAGGLVAIASPKKRGKLDHRDRLVLLAADNGTDGQNRKHRGRHPAPGDHHHEPRKNS